MSNSIAVIVTMISTELESLLIDLSTEGKCSFHRKIDCRVSEHVEAYLIENGVTQATA